MPDLALFSCESSGSLNKDEDSSSSRDEASSFNNEQGQDLSQQQQPEQQRQPQQSSHQSQQSQQSQQSRQQQQQQQQQQPSRQAPHPRQNLVDQELSQRQQQQILASTVRAPPIDIYDAPDAFRINVALPGVPPDCINIDYQYPSHELVIKGEVPWQIPFEQTQQETTNHNVQNSTTSSTASSVPVNEKYNSNYLKVNECWPLGGLFSRRIKFPAASRVDGSKVTADLKYGVVYINVPKVFNDNTSVDEGSTTST